MITRNRIFITGQVQGVGFRPAVYRLATQLKLTGCVYNDTKGVTIELQGEESAITEFITRLNGPDIPSLASITACMTSQLNPVAGEREFEIRQSDAAGSPTSRVTTDIATCNDCQRELFDKNDFRYRYPFINCTICGPRYSLIKTIPYDRPNTTMAEFKMCQRCAGQYHNVTDRRFHAQPIACPQCGPKIWLTDNKDNTTHTGTDTVISQTAKLLRAGKILAIKGIGGFHLAVDAFNDSAVRRLRQRKQREHKPFAMMADSIETIKQNAQVIQQAEDLLKSPQSPIVLLPKKTGSSIVPAVAEGVGTFGFMLPYAPLHHLLFAEGLKILVMTSANISDEPLICKNDEALERLGVIADAFLMHDREIFRQVDDSIVQFVDEQPFLLRRSRGYVPAPLPMKKSSPVEILATGSDLKNTFCFVKQNQLICSEHIGDLENAEVYHHYLKSMEHLRGLFEVKPEIVACDLHPAYLSSRYAHSLKNVKVIEVQHHWAHIASVIAEHGIDEPVIGLACDGTGYGTDGAVWGCETLISTLNGFERFSRLAYFPLAGADAASKEPIRPLLGLLMQVFGSEFNLDQLQWLLEPIEPDKAKQLMICEQIRKNINTVQSSSLGRVFDAVAAMLGLGNYNHFEAQLPMKLESIADEGCFEEYDFDLQQLFRQLLNDLSSDNDLAIISAKFHNTIAAGLHNMARTARQAKKLNTVALSGGVFCNRFLTGRLVRLLKEDGFFVLSNRNLPVNDGCIAAGQAVIAAAAARRSVS
jgi:hydrogenase maturation protein HypF